MKKVLLILFVSVLVLGIAGVVSAQQSAQQRGYMGGRTGQFESQDQSRDYGRQGIYGQQQQGQYGGQAQQGMSAYGRGQQMAGNFERASDLMDRKVMNQQGEELGQVSDLILTHNGQVAYLIVSRGGIMGVGDKYVPVPFRNAQWDQQQNAFVLPNVDKQKLANAPTINKDEWQRLEDPGFGRQIFSYYGPQGQQSGMGQQQWGTQQQQRPMQQPGSQSGRY